jgi:hypothetical protein
MSAVILSGPATLPLTYHDLVCVDDLDPLGRETQSDLETLEQDVLHILEEVLGSNLDDPNRGVGLLSILSGNTTILTNMAATIDGQLTKDTRIDASSTAVTNTGPNAFSVVVTVSVAGSVIGLYYATTAAGGLLPLPPGVYS